VYISRLMHFRIWTLLLALLHGSISAKTSWEIVESSQNRLQIRIHTDYEAKDDIGSFSLLVGLPSSDLPTIEIQRSDIQMLPHSVSDSLVTDITWNNVQQLRGLHTASLNISPLIDSEHYARSTMVSMTFQKNQNASNLSSIRNQAFLDSRVINWNMAKNWIIPKKKSRIASLAELPDGKWLRFTVNSDGIYSISGSDILSALPEALNYDINSIRLYTYSSGGREEMGNFLDHFGSFTYQPVPENLVECALSIDEDGGGTLSSNDKIYFYGRGADGFDEINGTVHYNKNIYFTENTYWLLLPTISDSDGKRIEEYNETVFDPISVNYGKVYQHIEADLTNPNKTGNLWVGPSIPKNSVYTLTYNSPNILPSLDGRLTLKIQREL